MHRTRDIGTHENVIDAQVEAWCMKTQALNVGARLERTFQDYATDTWESPETGVIQSNKNIKMLQGKEV